MEPKTDAVVRSWSARATPSGAQAYCEFFQTRLRRELARIPGHRGALVLERPEGSLVTITVLTFWESMNAVRAFAGDTIDRAVVEPEARAALHSSDESVTHHSIALDTLTSDGSV